MSTYTPQDETALRLAAIRWYMLSLEKLSNDIYITDRTKYDQINGILKSAFHALGDIRKSMSPTALEQDGCAPGYVNCDGICLPDCDRLFY
jgi:hypothetical protein